MPTAFATINLEALRHNCRVIQSHCPNKEMMAVIKSDAYGHGLVPIAKALQDQIAGYAVAHIDDAQRLRDANIQSPIMLLTGFLDRAALEQAIALDCQIVLHTSHQCDILKEMRLTKPVAIWVKIASDMHRLGFREEQLPMVYQTFQQCGMNKPYGYITHLPTLDVDDLTCAQAQGERFLSLLPKESKAKLTVANTAGIFKHGSWMMQHTDVIRPGRSLYGLSPFLDRSAADLGLKPVMRFAARIIAMTDLYPGESIGYGSAYQAAKKERIAIVGAGYADGYPRTTKGHVWIKRQLCPIRGYVCMDLMAIAIPEDDTIKIGDEVELWGPNLPIETIAATLDRSALDILMPLAGRVQRHYIFTLGN